MSYIFESPTDESKALSVLDRPFGPIDPPFEMNHFLVFLFFFTISTIPISGVSFRSRPVQEATLLNSAVDVSTDTRTITSTSASTSSASTSSASSTSVNPSVSASYISTDAAKTIVHVRAESIKRRLLLILPQIYQDVLIARNNLLTAVQICSGGGDWASQIVAESAAIRMATNTAVHTAVHTEALLSQLLRNMDDRILADGLSNIFQELNKVQTNLKTARTIAARASKISVNRAFGADILQAQTTVLSRFVLVTQALQHAVSICWIEGGGSADAAVADDSAISLPTSTATKKMSQNAAEQLALPFVPPNHKSTSAKTTSLQNRPQQINNCPKFCKPRSNSPLRASACNHGCRVASAVLSQKQWPGKWTDRVNCPEYCEKTVDQVMLGEEMHDGNDMEEEDQRAIWVAECNYSCKQNCV